MRDFILVIFIVIYTMLIITFKAINKKIARNKVEMILNFLRQEYHTFAELRDELPKLSTPSLTYLKLFDINFNLSDVHDTTKITITLYYSQKEIRKKLIYVLLNDPINKYVIGSISMESQYESYNNLYN